MFKKKYKQFNNSTNKSKLDQVLWFIENYLPQKKDRDVKKKMYRDNLEVNTFKIIVFLKKKERVRSLSF